MTKFILLILTLLIITISTVEMQAQAPSVERSVSGVQLGLFGAWIHKEGRLSNAIALRGEIGLDATFYYSRISEGWKYYTYPTVNIEPRWYCNLRRRVRKQKSIAGNSGNFLSIRSVYASNYIIGGDPPKGRLVSNIGITPTYGIRRAWGKHFTLEFAFGGGIRIGLLKEFGYSYNSVLPTISIQFKCGYRF